MTGFPYIALTNGLTCYPFNNKAVYKFYKQLCTIFIPYKKHHCLFVVGQWLKLPFRKKQVSDEAGETTPTTMDIA